MHDTTTITARLKQDEIPVLAAAAERTGVSKARFIAEAVRQALAEPTPSPT